MARPLARIVALQAALGAGLLLVLGRAGYLQIIKGGEFAARARAQRTVTKQLPARRGSLYDRNGRQLAVSEPVYRVQLSVKEVRDTQRVAAQVSRALGVSRTALLRHFRPGADNLYPYFHGPFRESVIGPLRRVPGIHLITAYSRGYPSGRLAAPVIGAVSPEEERGQSGLERSLDSILAGRPGERIDLRTPGGRQFESPGRMIREPVAGHDVILTIDAELQEIAENALRDALAEYRADNGDVVFLDPRSGELLALASLTASGPTTSATSFTSPFEPGSTAKPFAAAALLALGRVKPEETVSGENGKWVYATGPRTTRTIEDTHVEHEPMTLKHVIQVSSNIGIAKFSRKLRREEQYEMLRAFGFGSPTGVEYPSEASGSLPRPDGWRAGYDAESMATGYRIGMTPVQLAAAYGVFANDGVLLAPTLIREIRSLDRRTLYRSEPEVVRRVVSPEVAATMREFLAEAAGTGGTGSQAQVLGGILGKTGTARQVENGRYGNKHRASFVAIYPARDPQVVIVVTLDNPRGAYFGGQTAAPVTASMLSQVLSARRSVIDRSVVARTPAVGNRSPEREAPAESDLNAPASSIRLPAVAPAPPSSMVAMPEVAGRPVRGAVFAVHRRGLRARIEGSGNVVVKSLPAAGDSLQQGRTVVLYVSTRIP